MDNELYHYGVLGMKWGVRRYQNKDGTLTEAGKKRLSNNIVKADSKNDVGRVNRLVNEAASSYKKTSDSYSKAKTAYDVLNDKERQMEKIANDAAAKKVGMTMDEIRRKGQSSGDISNAIEMFKKASEYQKEGNAILKDLMQKTDYTKTVSEYKTAYQKAHNDGLNYVKSYMGKYGEVPLTNPMSITYDMKTGKVRPSTVAERMGVELTRDIWLRR